MRLQNLLNRSTKSRQFGARYSVLSANNLPGAKLTGNGVLCFAIASASALQPGRLQRLTSSSSAPPRSETAHQLRVTRVSDVMGEAVGWAAVVESELAFEEV